MREPCSVEGVYAVERVRQGRVGVRGQGEVKVQCIFGDIVHLKSSDGWEGVGILDGTAYRGVFRQVTRGNADGGMGEHTIDWSDRDHPTVKATYTSGRSDDFVEHWHRLDPTRPRAVLAPPGRAAAGHRPEFGEYVYVEELPEAITKVPPIYPDEARDKKIQGVVLVQALVLEDGTVGDVKVVHSIPGLDEAAAAAIRQWRFKPALTAGKPVAVWVATPIRFSIQ